jgi:hypothetical protein
MTIKIPMSFLVQTLVLPKKKKKKRKEKIELMFKIPTQGQV